MSNQYSTNDAQAMIDSQQLRLADGSTVGHRQRLLWLSSIAIPMLALTGMAMHFLFGNQLGGELWLALPIVITYVVLPIADLIIGEYAYNYDEQSMKKMEQDHFYRWLTYALIPIQLSIFIAMAFYAALFVDSWWGLILLGASAGLFNGLAINVGHELGHKTSKLERNLSKAALALPAYGHFCIEHNNGHHRHVATPEDIASSRMGESIYRFALREIPGAFKRGMDCESNRLAKKGKSFWSAENQILQSYVLSAILYGSLYILLGWKILPFLALNVACSWWQLTSANYIEHYGLLRDKTTNNKYESCKPHHSWNANSLFSNLLLFQLERHSDHHANPTRRYQVLRSFDKVPELPTGYFGMFLVAYVPWLWYRIMDKRVLAVPHINGDMSKVNIDPTRREQLVARYATA